MQQGTISVKAENILPIIKKWLYSDKDIFLREAISNASDAMYKLERLIAMGQAEPDDAAPFCIRVCVDKENKTLVIEDSGLGMTQEEVREYIAQVAFSGAVDFMEQYKEGQDGGIIGHFGLGFYSVFMVSESVEIDTLSYRSDAQPVRWISDGSSQYEIGEGTRERRGTTLTLHIGPDGEEFLDLALVRETICKYCSFLPFEIFLTTPENPANGEEAKPLNTTTPLWMKPAKECTDEEYRQFYREVFHDVDDPLFWIHLNVDSPFQLKSIIFFPRLRDDRNLMDVGQVKLYYNRVFVADNIKEILPEFLTVLKGVIDCPDIPINVSRSFLQNDGTVSKIAAFISKKVSDKLHSIFENSREQYEKYWEDIHVLVKYGCLRDSKFFDRMQDITLWKTTEGAFHTLGEWFADAQGDHKEKTLYYTDNHAQQSAAIALYGAHGIRVAQMEHPIDLPFSQMFEMKDSSRRFVCVTAELPEEFKTGKNVDEGEASALRELFVTTLSEHKIEVKVEHLNENNLPALLSLPEYTRRLEQMQKMYGQQGMEIPKEYILTVNRSHPLAARLLLLAGVDSKREEAALICRQMFDLGLMSLGELDEKEREEFVQRSYRLLQMIG